MFSIYRRLPKVNSLTGSKLSKPSRRPFGAGILPAYEDDTCHYGSLGLPTPLPVDPPVHSASTRERDYEAACVAVAGGQAEWLTSRPSVPDRNYFDECPELPPSAFHDAWPPDSDVAYWTARKAFDDACQEAASGADFWSDELTHLESLLPHATPARRQEINRRIAGVLEMMGPAREIERLQAESLERQLAESWAMDQIEAHAERFDGREWEEQEACRVAN